MWWGPSVGDVSQGRHVEAVCPVHVPPGVGGLCAAGRLVLNAVLASAQQSVKSAACCSQLLQQPWLCCLWPGSVCSQLPSCCVLACVCCDALWWVVDLFVWCLAWAAVGGHEQQLRPV